ncbi:hypothetical protein BJ742DRAFT_835658 [Cladochytrium replicatum]|nr:hypothetical protein BJ742DRAFT_835658 [Cladochytrium replicatum]
MYYLRELLLTYLLALPVTIALVIPIHKRQPTKTAASLPTSNVAPVNATNSTVLGNNSTNSTNATTIVPVGNGTNLTAWVLGNVSVPAENSTSTVNLTVSLPTAAATPTEITTSIESPTTTTTEPAPAPTDFVLMPVKRDVPILPPALNATTNSTTWINGSNSTNSTMFPLNSTNVTWPLNATNHTVPVNATTTTNTVTIPELATTKVVVANPSETLV